VSSFCVTEVSLIHLPVGGEECPRMRSVVLFFFIGEHDVASGVNGINVVRYMLHLTVLYQFQNIVHKTLVCIRPVLWR